MQVTKIMLENWQKDCQKKAKSNKDLENTEKVYHQFVYQLMKQSKQLSQLIARSWMEDDIALHIKDYFVAPGNSKSSDGKLKELLGNKGDGKVGQLLLNIFKPYELPIFDEYELAQVYSFSVYWDIWEGSINDIQQPQTSGSYYFNIKIPYPPRPQLGESTFTMQQLQDWVNQDVTDEQGNLLIDDDHPIHPPYPYIPATCC